jgi:hypothetical protein
MLLFVFRSHESPPPTTVLFASVAVALLFAEHDHRGKNESIAKGCRSFLLIGFTAFMMLMTNIISSIQTHNQILLPAVSFSPFKRSLWALADTNARKNKIDKSVRQQIDLNQE